MQKSPPSAKTVPTKAPPSNNYGGKTTEQLKKLGRTAARYAAQGKKV